MTATSAGGSPVLPALRAEVATVANHTVEMARDLERPELADAVTAVAQRWSDQRLRVGFTGVSGAGKSSLINALCFRKVIDGVPPGVLVEVTDGDEPRALAAIAGSDQITEWGKDELAGGTRDGRTLSALRIETPDVELLRDVEFVELPASNLAGGVGETVARAARRCDVVVHVRDATSPITQPELTQLSQIAGSANTLILVMTKTDLVHGWRENLETTLTLADSNVGAHRVEGFGVALPLVDLAIESAERDSDGSVELYEESGVGELRDFLIEDLGHRLRSLRLENVLLTCRSALEDLEEPTRMGLAAIEGPATIDDLLQAEADALARLRTDSSAWMREAADGCSRVRDALAVTMSRLVARATRKATAEAAERSRPDDAVLADFLDSLDDVHAELVDEADRRLVGLAEALATEIEATAVREIDTPERPEARLAASHGGGGSGMSIRVSATIAQLGSSTAFAWWLYQSPGGGAAMRGGFMLLAGLLGTTATVVGARQARRQKQAAEAVNEIRRISEEWKATESAAMRSWILRGQRELEDRLRAVIGDQRKAHENNIRALRAAKSGAAVGGPAAAAAIATRVDALLARVAAA
jgi:GTP-binding protein EngB required for normal cell division